MRMRIILLIQESIGVGKDQIVKEVAEIELEIKEENKLMWAEIKKKLIKRRNLRRN